MHILRGMQLLGLPAPQLLEDGLFIVRRRRWMKSKEKRRRGKMENIIINQIAA